MFISLGSQFYRNGIYFAGRDICVEADIVEGGIGVFTAEALDIPGLNFNDSCFSVNFQCLIKFERYLKAFSREILSAYGVRQVKVLQTSSNDFFLFRTGQKVWSVTSDHRHRGGSAAFKCSLDIRGYDPGCLGHSWETTNFPHHSLIDGC